jgi:hypothetical protein
MSAGRARTRFDRVAPSRGALEARAAPVALTSLAVTISLALCASPALAGSSPLANYDSEPLKNWLIEGSAAWVESDLVSKDFGVRSFWRSYLKNPGKPLFTRAYDAIGFFGHMASTAGLDPWGRFKDMFEATGSAAAYAAGIGGSTAFLDSESSAFFREPAFGPEWNTRGPNVPTKGEVGFKPTVVDVTGKSHAPLVVAPYADGAYDLSIGGLPVTAPVLELTVVSGNVRLHSTSGGSVDEVDPKQLQLCSDPKGCNCPGESNHYEDFQRGDLAVAGGPTGGEVKLTPHKPCEELLPAHSCQGLLPEFTVPVPQTLEKLVGMPLSAESKHGEASASVCDLLAKGHNVVSGPEGEASFDGVTAVFVSVIRYPSIGLATLNFQKMAAPPGLKVSHPPGIGEEADLYTLGTTNADGQLEYGAQGIVRVHNLIAQFSIFGSPGSTEADPEAARALLAHVASTL